MAAINTLTNSASVTFNGSPVVSNSVQTLLELVPTIVKAVDKATASINDILTYTVTVTNIGATEITDLPFADTLPTGSAYVADSFKVNNTAETPTVTDNAITYTIPSISAAGTAIITFQAAVVGGEV